MTTTYQKDVKSYAEFGPERKELSLLVTQSFLHSLLNDMMQLQKYSSDPVLVRQEEEWLRQAIDFYF